MQPNFVELWKQMKTRSGAAVAVAVFSLLGFGAIGGMVGLVSADAAAPLVINRASLAKSASFTATQTLIPKGGTKSSRSFQVEVKGNKARVDYQDELVGSVRYVLNEKGAYQYFPGNNSAVKVDLKGGVEGALKYVFQQVNEQLAGAKKIGTATVSGQQTDIYKDAKTGALIYVGKSPGFHLPVKTLLTNEGGTNTLLVSNIKLNIAIADNRFVLPKGAQLIDGGNAGRAGGGVPGGMMPH
jgi:outer membrane lipoprotein-sorting protein